MRKARPVFNVQLRVDDTFPGSHSLPYTGSFTVLSNGKLVRGTTERLGTYLGLVDMASMPPLHVDFDDKNIGLKYLVREKGYYYLKDQALEVTAEVIETTVRAAMRYRT